MPGHAISRKQIMPGHAISRKQIKTIDILQQSRTKPWSTDHTLMTLLLILNSSKTIA